MNPSPALRRPAEILLVEDNDNDVELTRLGFAQCKLSVHLHRVRNGEECMAFLRKEGEYAGRPTPDLLLLDINMPRLDGREALAAIAGDGRLCHLPIVVLTTSTAEQDLLAAYQLRCSSYIVKPVDYQQFVRVIQSLYNYWFTVVALPPPG